MKKIAIFVEGQTEQELAVWLVKSIAGSRGLYIAMGKQFANKVQLTATAPSPGTSFYVLIVDCACDAQVKTQINEQYPTLIGAGFSEIIGLRDIYPLPIAKLPLLLQNLTTNLPNGPVVPKIHVAVHEVEAWFIREVTHFPRLHLQLTTARIEHGGFPISTYDAEAWEHPADTLHAIYKLEKLAYKKTIAHVRRTIAALSFAEFSTNVRASIPALAGFLKDLDSVFQ